jgi:hypothetical protein
MRPVIGFIILSFMFATPVHATDSQVTQSILPLHCIYQIVNDGSGTIIYLTPVECGRIISPSPPATLPIDTTNGTQQPQLVTTVVDTGTQSLQILPFIPIVSQSGSKNSTVFTTAGATYQPIITSTLTNKNAVIQTPNVVAPPVVAAVGLSLFVIILLILFI